MEVMKMSPISEKQRLCCSWERTGKVNVCALPGHARYPSLIRVGEQDFCVLFTGKIGLGKSCLQLVRSSDGGATWGNPETLFESNTSEPRAVNTMTRLSSGKIIAPFIQWQLVPPILIGEQQEIALGLLYSDDDAQSWSLKRVEVESPLVWFSPCGRIIETTDGKLCVAVHGATRPSDLRSTIHGCALLRSEDGGSTWGEFTWIVRGNGSVIGAHAKTRFSFEGPAVETLEDGRWLAVVSARRFGNGPGSPQVLCRLWSEDEGRTWSRPDQLTVGSWPAISRVGGSVACAFAEWSGFGQIRLLISDDGLETFRQEKSILAWGWLSGQTYRHTEAPLPPIVPHDGEAWVYEHYGFPSILAVDEKCIAVAIGRTQKESMYWAEDGAESRSIPKEHEKIEVITFEGTGCAEASQRAHVERRAKPRGRWVLTRRSKIADFDSVTQTPGGDIIGVSEGVVWKSDDVGEHWEELKGATIPGGVFGVLKSGRWLAARGHHYSTPVDGTVSIVGNKGGYPLMKVSGHSVDCDGVVSYSDDEGRSWQDGLHFRAPLQWVHPYGRFGEFDDETIYLTAYGCLTKEDADCYAGCNGIFRSRDGGRSWGDFSLIFRHGTQSKEDPQPEPRYTELDVIPMRNKLWVALSRTEFGSVGPRGFGGTSIAFSRDRGRTWSQPVFNLKGGGQQFAVALSNGGLAILTRSASWQGPALYVSYDGGVTWDYTVGGPSSTSGLVKVGDDSLIAFTNEGRDCALYRWEEEPLNASTYPA